MKKIIHTITSGFIGFWIPILIIFLLLEKMFSIIHRIVVPLEAHLPSLKIWGITSIVILVVILMIALCFIGGLLIKMDFIQKKIKVVESTILSHIPGYNTFKIMFDNETMMQEDMNWNAVLITEDEDMYSVGYTTYSSEHFYVVHRITTASLNEAELLIISKSKVKLLNISSEEFIHHVKRVKNTAELVEKALSWTIANENNTSGTGKS